MMRQFFEAEAQHENAILLFRMGDFYETFFEDAVEASRILELTLTSRNKKDDDPIPMAGVPHHSVRAYIARLLEAGRKVAICDQVEDPRVAKGLVKREVVRLITPGVVLDDDTLQGNKNNFLVALWRASESAREVGLAWADASTGQVSGTALSSIARAFDELARIEPAELLVSAADESLGRAVEHNLDARSLAISQVADPSIAGKPRAADPVVPAHRMLLDYVESTQRDGELPLRPIERYEADAVLRLGAATVRNLELVKTLTEGTRRGSVLGLIDHTRTAMGARLLKQWLLTPLVDPADIRHRHDAVEAFVNDPIARAEIRDELEAVYDLERLVTRIVVGAAGPRDVVALAGSLERVPRVRDKLEATGIEALIASGEGLDPVPEAVRVITEALVEEPPAVLKDGGVIREGFNDELDELLAIARDGKAWFAAYAAKLREETGISSLKVRYNNVFGYFIEVTRANLHLVPETWLRKQTLANAERYYTADLKEREEKVLGADERRVALEHELFEETRQRVATLGARIQATANHIATIDVLGGLAELAQRRGYSRPEVDSGRIIHIDGGRHPVIEAMMPAGEFVPNDISIDPAHNQLVIITGPNMAGKSTVMRQVALIAILAQMGSFVPADHARIGVVDQVFTRVGASDNLSRGQSTFMVEMTEASTILAQATRQSLIILDEIGRGTSTYDGVSIAWAVAEYIHDHVGARTLFATHYHELTELAATRERTDNMTIAVREWQDEIVFLRRLVPGGCNRSYGIQVARLAGLPAPIVERASEILETLESNALDPDSRPRIARKDGNHPQAW